MTSSSNVREAERRLFEVELLGLDLREVEDVVDDRQQVARRAVRDAQQYCCWRGVSGVSSASPVMLMTAFIGVRISWLITARNALFARLAASAAGRRLGHPGLSRGERGQA